MRGKALDRKRAASLQSDVRPIAAQINELAGKYGIAPSTVAKHALLLPVPVPGLRDWNERIASR